tara:strand:- start:213 stop:464 length:252 start_codon:yes stop_codon:yes gene_type:complete
METNSQNKFHLVDRPTKANIEEELFRLAYDTNQSWTISWGRGGALIKRGMVPVSPRMTKKEVAIFIAGIRAGVIINYTNGSYN